MNNKVLSTLEFLKILDRLSGLADSTEGKKLALKLRPSSDIKQIEICQAETEEAVVLLRKKGSPGFSGLSDIREALKRLEISASLSIPELISIQTVLNIAGKVKAYAAEKLENQRVEKEEKTSNSNQGPLSPYFSGIVDLYSERKEIGRCIISEEEIADNASSELSDIRRRLGRISARIHEELNNVLNRSRSILQDVVITMRDGRYCLPVKLEHKSEFSGIVHDQSSSGLTLFMEPMAVVRLNNELNELKAEEKREIEKILTRLSDSLRPHIELILSNLKLLSELDFIFARARLGEEMKAVKPVFNEEYRIYLKKARHPLIAPESVVPVDVELGRDFSMLIITGPNTGGKTVLLKTVGLLQLMGQAGLFIPAFSGSELSVFQEIFADIGDEQSIEQSLSTFSSHMVNTVGILEKADAHSLCLFDELGAGTDPTEGAALAMSILSFLHNMTTRTIATTHYAELKVYAISTEGVENAACEFNVETLRPTYRVLIGVPGKSNAFAISKRLGLPDYIIEDARRRLDESDLKLEDVIARLEESRLIVEKEQREISAYKQEIEEYKRRTRESSKGMEKGRDKILRNAREEAAKILSEAKETADEIVKELRRQEMLGGSSINAEKTRSVLNKKLRETQESDKDIKVKGPKKTLSVKNIHLGDAVRVLSLKLNATVKSLPDKDGNLYVMAGIIRSKVNVKDLELISEPHFSGPGIDSLETASGKSRSHQKASKARSNYSPSDKAFNSSANGYSGSSSIGVLKSISVSPELNLIGKTTLEAMPELSKYLDDASLAHLSEVRIVHGRGTGALKRMVHDNLRKNRLVKDYRLGEFGEGSDGVTIVSLV